MTSETGTPSATQPVALKRALSLPLILLYGLGVTIGAGIYVLIGATASVAGTFAPLAFVTAALVMLPSACAFAELVGRYPKSAGEAAYVRAGFNSAELSLFVGLMVVTVGIVSAAAICVGSVGYIRQLIDVPALVLIPIVVIAMTAIASVGVRESVTFAGVMTVIEIVGLLVVIVAGLWFAGVIPEQTSVSAVSTSPTTSSTVPTSLAFAILSGGVVAFFAFVGFEDLVNMAEEVERPATTLPKAIFLTLAISTLLYVLVAFVAVRHVAINELASAEAPLSLVFERTTAASPVVISLIAIIATLNGVIVQMIMSSRVIYGLSAQGNLPAVLGTVHETTRTPIIATALVGAIILTLAMFVPLRGLAELTSLITLTIFSFVNVALLLIKRRGEPALEGTFVVPVWVPVLGLLSCLTFLVVGIL